MMESTTQQPSESAPNEFAEGNFAAAQDHPAEKAHDEGPAQIDTTRVRGLTGIYAVDLALRHAWKVIVGVVGATITLFGVTLLFIPGPGIVFIGIGLGILATEFVWARLWLKRLKRAALDATRAVTGGGKSENESSHSKNG